MGDLMGDLMGELVDLIKNIAIASHRISLGLNKNHTPSILEEVKIYYFVSENKKRLK